MRSQLLTQTPTPHHHYPKLVLRLWQAGPVAWRAPPNISQWLPAVQTYALAVSLCQSLLLDPELLVGLKQATYHSLGLQEPMTYATKRMQNLTNHMRHPVVLAPMVALLAVETVTWDRVLLVRRGLRVQVH